ncbi:chaplin family protein [Streptomyces sp. NPDC057743]|uniref:chaplin family protein n=1 Tax=Streptomyces sp. NPDC057743 TaxID=3346236 RepID=UPI0036A78BDD
MTKCRSFALLGLTSSVAVGAGFTTAAPASAGGIVVVGSPSFGNGCVNRHAGAHASGGAIHGSGTVSGLLAKIPAALPLNHCGGADFPDLNLLPESNKSNVPVYVSYGALNAWSSFIEQ